MLSRKPAKQSGLDVAANPKLKQRERARRADCYCISDVHSAAVERSQTMRIMYRCCAGLDVHKETVLCCVRRVEADGSLQEVVKHFGTMTEDLLEMVESLKAQGVTTWRWNRPAYSGSRFTTAQGRVPRVRSRDGVHGVRHSKALYGSAALDPPRFPGRNARPL